MFYGQVHYTWVMALEVLQDPKPRTRGAGAFYPTSELLTICTSEFSIII